ncbi:MAG TPA: MTH938/NDUFAF3 family protein [Pseudolabrys sp.]|jgi:uncharacterized protein
MEGGKHLPQAAPIDGYGSGGFTFAGMSHRGSLLCLPDGLWAWPVSDVRDITTASLEMVFARAADLHVFLIGAGRDPWRLPDRLRDRFRTAGISVDAMTTGAAAQTYNILLGENRRVGAGLIAVE